MRRKSASHILSFLVLNLYAICEDRRSIIFWQQMILPGNGCGKSTFIKAVLGSAGMGEQFYISEGELQTESGLKIS